MDKLIELLPLPSVLLNWPHPTNHVAIRDYARACVAHATAAKDAEIEALRAEVERLKAVAHGFVDEIADKDRRAERLAEALREAADMLLADYPETAKRLRALLPTAAQEKQQ